MLEALRQTLVKTLHPRQFEHLVATAASALTGMTFRLAKSGQQFGSDASAQAVKLEVKAYLHHPPPDVNLLGKLAQAAIDGRHQPEIWVLAATVAIPAQTHDALEALGRKLGTHIVILDWPNGPLPALLVLLAAAQEATLTWIQQHHPHLHEPLRVTFQHLHAANAGLPKASQHLKTNLVPVLASYRTVQKSLEDAYLRAFADRSTAMNLFGQALNPLSAPGYIDRPKVFDRIAEQFHEQAGFEPLVILGEEGVGKTWVIASYWYRRARDALFVLIPSKAALLHGRNGASALLEAALQTAFRATEDPTLHWPLRGWCGNPDPARRVLIVLDGLNEQPCFAWPALIRQMSSLVTSLGGHLVLTCRPRFWHLHLAERFADEGFRFEHVEGFDEEEFAAALRQTGHDPERFSPTLSADLRNPRIFALASGLLDSLDPTTGAITKERVLWEYWRHRRRGKDDIVLSEEAFRALLIEHARSAWEEIRQCARHPHRLRGQELPSTRDALAIARGESVEQLTADLLDVADGTFFRLIGRGSTARHTFVPDKLWYALGLRLAYEVTEACESDPDALHVRETVAQILEPILDMDVAADILLAAFAVAALYPRMRDAVACWFLVELIEFRNRHDELGSFSDRAEETAAYVAEAPDVYIQAADFQMSTPWGVDYWVLTALRQGFRVAGKPAQQIQRAVRRWLANLPANISDHEVSEPNTSVVLALQIIAGHSCLSFESELLRVLDSRLEWAASLVLWLYVLNEATPWSDTFSRSIDRRPPLEAPARGSLYPGVERPNAALEQTLLRWRAACGGYVRPTVWQQLENLIERQWNVALAPSLPACLPTSAQSLQVVHRLVTHRSRPIPTAYYILEAQLVNVPVEDRIGLLSTLTLDAGNPRPVFPAGFLPCLGEEGADRYLRTVLAAAGYTDTASHTDIPSPPHGLSQAEFAAPAGVSKDSQALGATRWALDFLQGAPRISLSEPCQRFLIHVIEDHDYPTHLRASAMAVAARCRAGLIARYVADKAISSRCEKTIEEISASAKLLESAVWSRGVYPAIRARLRTVGICSALATVHPRDFPLVLSDLDFVLRADCAAHCREPLREELNDDEVLSDILLDGASTNDLVPEDASADEEALLLDAVPVHFTRETVGRLVTDSPGALESWILRLEWVLDRIGHLSNLQDLAHLLLPTYADLNPSKAARFLSRLLDLHTRCLTLDPDQQRMSHGLLYEAFSMRSHPAIDAQLERMIRTCTHDMDLARVVEAACTRGRSDWLAAFARREIQSGHFGRSARARYVLALAGLPSHSIAGRGSSFCDAVECRAVQIETDRRTFLAALERWKHARTPDERFGIEVEMFEALSGFHVCVNALEADELGELLHARISQAQEDARRARLSGRLFGLAAPPGWMTLANAWRAQSLHGLVGPRSPYPAPSRW